MAIRGAASHIWQGGELTDVLFYATEVRLFVWEFFFFFLNRWSSRPAALREVEVETHAVHLLLRR